MSSAEKTRQLAAEGEDEAEGFEELGEAEVEEGRVSEELGYRACPMELWEESRGQFGSWLF